MSTASCLLTEDHFLCSICLDVFTDPVTIPCGHNFCKNCITEHWNINVQSQCTICERVYNTRPELQVNNFISEMAAQFRQSAQQEASRVRVAKPEVPCDVCTGTKLKALKSCLLCLASYCETHLEPHLTMSHLKRHQLIDPVENLEGRMCTEHDKLLELFCKDDQMFVCTLCTSLDHKTHEFVPLKEEYEGKKTELGKIEADVQQMIQKVQRPYIVGTCNKYMGGVDLLDSFAAKYRFPMKTHPWYIYIFWHTIILAVINAWLLYKWDCKALKMSKKEILNRRQFQAQLTSSLILVNTTLNTSQRGRPSSGNGSPVTQTMTSRSPLNAKKRPSPGHGSLQNGAPANRSFAHTPHWMYARP